MSSSFAGASYTSGEDVEDQLAAVDDPAADPLLQLADLRRGELVVKDHEAGAGLLDQLVDRLDLPAADEGCRVGWASAAAAVLADPAATLDDPADGGAARRRHQALQLIQAQIGRDLRVGGVEADEHGAIAVSGPVWGIEHSLSGREGQIS